MENTKETSNLISVNTNQINLAPMKNLILLFLLLISASSLLNARQVSCAIVINANQGEHVTGKHICIERI